MYSLNLPHKTIFSLTPCELVINSKTCFLVPEKVVELFPKDPDLKPKTAECHKLYGLPPFRLRPERCRAIVFDEGSSQFGDFSDHRTEKFIMKVRYPNFSTRTGNLTILLELIPV